MREDLPGWARRIRALREARGMTQVEAAEQMRQHSDRELPDTEHLLRRWKSWESGASKPTQYASIVAATLGLLAVSSGFGPAWRVDGGKIVSLTA